MDTKQRILDEALTLFSEKGYANVYVNDIAEKVGIKAPSLYKHYKSKQAIFDAIIKEMNRRFSEEAEVLQIAGNDAKKDAEIYTEISEEQMIQIGIGLFQYYLHDDYTKRFRKMLTIEQFHDKELAKVYSKQYVDDPLSYQGMLFGMMVAQGLLQTENVPIMTLHFYSPIYLLLTLCDREPQREEEAIKIMTEHVLQFNRLYGRKKK
ncbi:MAG: TetR/AcrR family transcriptional regulator [Lachnospiraceae bacterium]|nr:TetR/AcrR family transcriptional regulator [Lachnospiraceae bacterium]